MARSWPFSLAPSLLLLAFVLGQSACAKPAGTSGTSGELDTPDPKGEAQVEFVDAPDPNSCPESNIRTVRYGSTVDRSVKLPAKLGAVRCYEDPYAKLEADVACARDFNLAARGHALYEAGLAQVDMERVEIWNERARYGGLEVGSVHPHPELQGREMVFLGLEGSDCSGYSSYNSAGPGLSLARNQAGEVVVVRDRPNTEVRHYPRCGCFSGCGAAMEPMPVFGLLPEGARRGADVELVYAAIVITSNAVDTQSCCCAP